MAVINSLLNQLKSFDRLPFLFVGSGLSRRYRGMPTWGALLDYCSQWTGKSFNYYLSKSDNDFPQAATLIAEEFHEIWWSKSEYTKNRGEAESYATHKHSPLKIEVANLLRSFENTPSDSLIEELRLLSEAKVSGIITTNYDQILEEIFPNFVPYIGQEELLFNPSPGLGEIYKIHGCLSAPNSLVLTSVDYERFNSQSPYLIAKLLTIFVENPIIFLGYSLQDANINSILRSVVQCLSKEKMRLFSQRIFFVEWIGDGAQEDSVVQATLALSNVNLSLPVTHIKVNGFVSVFETLKNLEQGIPIHLLRVLKDKIYNLVLSREPNVDLFVREFEEGLSDIKTQTVLGIGKVKKSLENPGTGDVGYISIEREDLFSDLILNDQNYDSTSLVRQTIPALLKKSKFVPVYKYIAAAVDCDQEIAAILNKLEDNPSDAIETRVRRFFPNSKSYLKQEGDISKLGSINELLSTEEKPMRQLMFLPMMKIENIGLQDLESFIKSNLEFLQSGNAIEKNQMQKIICLYDLLSFGRGI